LFAYLFLVALYESWNIPIPVLLSVSVAILGALVAVAIAGLSFDVYAQIGLVALIALPFLTKLRRLRYSTRGLDAFRFSGRPRAGKQQNGHNVNWAGDGER
jgi:AcrB/AcrD/AcrF family